jgi:hypothetical protein
LKRAEGEGHPQQTGGRKASSSFVGRAIVVRSKFALLSQSREYLKAAGQENSQNAGIVALARSSSWFRQHITAAPAAELQQQNEVIENGYLTTSWGAIHCARKICRSCKRNEPISTIKHPKSKHTTREHMLESRSARRYDTAGSAAAGDGLRNAVQSIMNMNVLLSLGSEAVKERETPQFLHNPCVPFAQSL